MLAKAMTAELSIELNEATLYADDDGASEIVKEFKRHLLPSGLTILAWPLPRPYRGQPLTQTAF